MATLTATKIPTRVQYDRMAQEYMSSLPPEHFMERSDHARHPYAIPELEMDVALEDECVHYWFRGLLQPVIRELKSELKAEGQKVKGLEAEVQRLRDLLSRSTPPPA